MLHSTAHPPDQLTHHFVLCRKRAGRADVLLGSRPFSTVSAAHCLLADRDELEAMRLLEASTYAGRPFGDEQFVAAMAARFGRGWGADRQMEMAGVAPR